MDRENELAQGMCLGEVLGELDGMYSEFATDRLKPAFCIPVGAGVSDGQLQDIVYKYVNAHPERRHWHMVT